MKREHHLDIKVVQIGRFGKEDLDSSSKIKSRIVEGARKTT